MRQLIRIRTNQQCSSASEQANLVHRSTAGAVFFILFTEYAYAVESSQPEVPRTIHEARAMPDAAEWNEAANREMARLRERAVIHWSRIVI